MNVVPEHLRPLLDSLWLDWAKKHTEYFEKESVNELRHPISRQ